MHQIHPSNKKYFYPPRMRFLDFILKYNLKIESGVMFGKINGQFFSCHSLGHMNFCVFTLLNNDAVEQVKTIIKNQNIKNANVKFNQLEIRPSQSFTDKMILAKVDRIIQFWTDELSKIQKWDKFDESNDFVLINDISAPKDERYFEEYEQQLKKYISENNLNNIDALVKSFVETLPLNLIVSSMAGVGYYLIHRIVFPLNFIIAGGIFLKSFKRNVIRFGKFSWIYLFFGLVCIIFTSLLISTLFTNILTYKVQNFLIPLDNFFNSFKVENTQKTYLILMMFLLLVSNQRKITEDYKIQDGWRLDENDIFTQRRKIKKTQAIVLSFIGFCMVCVIGIIIYAKFSH